MSPAMHHMLLRGPLGLQGVYEIPACRRTLWILWHGRAKWASVVGGGVHRGRSLVAGITACRSRAALTYAEAQSRIDDARLSDELSANLRWLNQVRGAGKRSWSSMQLHLCSLTSPAGFAPMMGTDSAWQWFWQ